MNIWTLIYFFLPWGRKKKRESIIFFTEQLIAVTEENLPLVPGLKMIASDTKQVWFRHLIQAVARDMEEGKSLSESLSRWRRIFPRLYLKMVDIGERNGNLSQLLRHLLDHFQRMDKFREKMRELLFYPGIPLLYIFSILPIFIKLVFPVFRKMFTDMETGLPASTRYLIAASNWLTTNSDMFSLGLIILLFVLGTINLLAKKTSLARLLLDRLYLGLPVVGPLVREVSLVRFSHTLGTLLESGVPLDEALETTGEVPMNRLLQRETKRMAGEIREGERFSRLLPGRKLFPSTFTWITAVGEGRGVLEKSLFQAGDFYRLRFEADLTRIVATSMPVFVLIEGGLVAFIAIGMFAALVAMANSLM
ncbi:MAG: type II secretion system F family protein [Nitrospirae bacterium]|nr:type II secretion system F family protein [Nitrospirota bacterium]